MATDISWYEHWKKEYQELCNSRFADIRTRMAKKFKNADDYILKEYMKPTLKLYKDVDMRMDYLDAFVKKNYKKDPDKFHEVCRDSHEFNRNHSILKDLIEGLQKRIKNKTINSACEFLQNEAGNILMKCAYYVFAYENKFRRFGFLVERLVV